MSKEKIFSVAKATFEVTKMVLVVAAKTTCKLISVGKEEVTKQYREYYQKATNQQQEAIDKLGTSLKQVLDRGAKGTSNDSKLNAGASKKGNDDKSNDKRM
ncbi:uncharacterized protein LOC132699987 [Cylas formicarius]|uniref:uncharacterized protein LOC132699987 n=1 Tax=Cylas formicarius TaxID=197179 RepID=UPI002958621A|nr:uncharacterized protein LOC132699987 [Cylas formicarius]